MLSLPAVFYRKFAPKNTANTLDRKIRIGAVNYLNTKPLLHGLKIAPVHHAISLTLDYPAHIATMLLNDEIDLGLVPVAILPKLKSPHIDSDYCIGCDGEVSSVAIFSEKPLEELKTVLLDYQSRTSVALAKILIKQYWKLEPVLVDTKGEEFRHEIQGTTGGLIIGDRALEQRHISKYHYDLGKAWKAFTGLPFVFAAWVSNKALDPDFVREFNAANKAGLEHFKEIIHENPFPYFNLNEYYSRYISYELNEEKRKGLHLFLEMLKTSATSSVGGLVP